MSKTARVRVPDLTRLDRLELEKQLGSDAVSFETEDGGAETHGELATATAIVIVSLAALRVLAIHLARKHQRKEFKVVVEIEEPSGRRKKVTLESSESSKESPDAQVLAQLASACEVDVSPFLKN